MHSEIRLALTLTFSLRRDFPEFFARSAPLNRSGGHPACRRGPASCRPKRPWHWITCSGFCQTISAGLAAPALRQAGCPPLRGSWAGNHQLLLWEKSLTSEHSPALKKILRLPIGWGAGQGENSPKTFFAFGTSEAPEAGRAGCHHPAATFQSVQLARRRGEDTQPYLSVRGEGFVQLNRFG